MCFLPGRAEDRPMLAMTQEQWDGADRYVKMNSIGAAIAIIVAIGIAVGVVYMLNHYKPWELPKIIDQYFLTALPAGIGGLSALALLGGGIYAAVQAIRVKIDPSKYVEFSSKSVSK